MDANGLNTTLAYDAKGRLLTRTIVSASGNRVQHVGYDAADNITSSTDSSGLTTSYLHNTLGQITQRMRSPATHPNGDESKDIQNIGYNALGQLLGYTAKQSYLYWGIVGWQGGEPIEGWVLGSVDYSRTEWTYDNGGFLSSTIGSASQNVRYSYNQNGDLSSITDSQNRVTSFSYDWLGRIKTASSPNGGAVQLEYDALGRLVKYTDRIGSITTYSYSGFGDVIQIVSPDSGTTTYTYDQAGRVASVTKSDGTTTTITRDLIGRVVQEASSDPGTPANTFGYDCITGIGRRCSFTDASGSTTYTYHATGELASQVSVIDGVPYSLTFAYDSHGRLSHAVYPGTELRYSYTADHRTKRIEAKVSGAWLDVMNNAVYQPFGGPLTGFQHGNGLTRQLDYDQDSRLKKIWGVGTGHPQNLTISYDNNDLVTGIANSKNTAASQTYLYNDIGALVSAHSTATGTQTWQYDLNGNRSSHSWGGATDVYSTTAGSNRLNAIAGSRPRTLGYDGAGRLISDTRGGGQATRGYNGFGRQTLLSRSTAQTFVQPNGATIALPAGSWSYKYNAIGQRTQKQQTSPASVATRYLFSPDGVLLGESNPGSTSINTIYVWLGRTPIGVVRAGALYHVHADHLNRPEVVTSSTKTVVWKANNYAFDRLVSVDNFGGLALGLPGQQYDVESATWYNVFRDYDAATGRYTKSDPIGLNGGVSPYAYVSGNPVSRFDPLGLDGEGCPKTCVGTARVLQGNNRHLGKSGGFSTPNNDVFIDSGSAAVIPEQWADSKADLRPYIGEISGRTTDGIQLFLNIADVVGPASARTSLQQRYPDTLIIELPGADIDQGTLDVEITVPGELDCPTGTTEVL